MTRTSMSSRARRQSAWRPMEWVNAEITRNPTICRMMGNDSPDRAFDLYLLRSLAMLRRLQLMLSPSWRRPLPPGFARQGNQSGGRR
jgi:hypothetical protein